MKMKITISGENSYGVQSALTKHKVDAMRRRLQNEGAGWLTEEEQFEVLNAGEGKHILTNGHSRARALIDEYGQYEVEANVNGEAEIGNSVPIENLPKTWWG